MNKLFTLDQALALDSGQIEKLHQQYLNPDLVKIMSLIGFNRNFVSAHGSTLVDAAGDEYIDCLGSYGAMNIGHNHPKVWAAIERVRETPKMTQASLSGLAGALAHNLSALTNNHLEHVFFCNSGAEAVEGALKIARAATKRTMYVSATHSFHGKSFGALSVTGQDKYQEPFGPLLPGCIQVPFNDIEALERTFLSYKGKIAAFIVEPTQGEGGVVPAKPGYLREVGKLCARYRVLLILDEIQTGIGRTGSFFAYQQEGVLPDIMCLAKSLGGGIMPIGAYMTRAEIWQKAYHDITLSRALLHTSTFGGNAMACAAALATIEVVIEEDLAGRAKISGQYLLAKLCLLANQYPQLLHEVRGSGLLIGMEFRAKGSALGQALSLGLQNKLRAEFLGSLVAGELLRRQILTAYTLNRPNVVRVEPPLCITTHELDRLVYALTDVLRSNRSFGGLAKSQAFKSKS